MAFWNTMGPIDKSNDESLGLWRFLESPQGVSTIRIGLEALCSTKAEKLSNKV